MKTSASLLCIVLLSALAAETAAARPITVELTATINYSSDMSGTMFGGQAAVGQRLTASYTYETNAPDLDPRPYIGDYSVPTLAPVNMRMSVGSLVFESVASPQAFSAYVTPAGSPGSAAGFRLLSSENKPLPAGGWGAGSAVYWILFICTDRSGQFVSTDALPAGVPNPSSVDCEISVTGTQNGYQFEVRAPVETATLVPPAIAISPADGSFLSQQRFDAAVFLPLGSQIRSAQASAGGNALPLSYPGTCQLIPANGLTRPAILCPDAHTVLPTANGLPIDWQVELADDTLLDKSVDWKLVP